MKKVLARSCPLKPSLTPAVCVCGYYVDLPHCTIQKQTVIHNSVQENVQFNAAASDISKEVYQASKRLQQLTQCTFPVACVCVSVLMRG